MALYCILSSVESFAALQKQGIQEKDLSVWLLGRDIHYLYCLSPGTSTSLRPEHKKQKKKKVKQFWAIALI